VGRSRISYNGDLGVYLGYALETHSFGFRKEPFANSHQVRAGWAFKAGSGRIDYTGEFHRENRGSFFGLYAFGSGVEVLRFYGAGNESPASSDDERYKVDARQTLLYPTFRLPFSKKGLLTVGPALKYTWNDEGTDQFVNQAKPYGSGRFGELALHGILSWDTRDSEVFPRRGVFAAARGTWFLKAWDAQSSFGQVNGNLNAYLSGGRRATLALRLGGKKVFGTYPYLEAATIGEGGLGVGALEEPEDTVRGYRARRYLGDASAWANSSLRLKVSRLTLVVPGEWGIDGFADVGRVWLEGESSDKWHPGYGGGLWVSLLKDRLAFTTGLAHSSEDDIFYLKGHFSY
jgi:outer membrane protein assembly factor BamA